MSIDKGRRVPLHLMIYEKDRNVIIELSKEKGIPASFIAGYVFPMMLQVIQRDIGTIIAAYDKTHPAKKIAKKEDVPPPSFEEQLLKKLESHFLATEQSIRTLNLEMKKLKEDLGG